MRSTLAILALLASLTVAVSLKAQTRRGMTPEDTLRFAEVGDAQISPSGEWVVYVVATTEGEERRSALWLVRAGPGAVTSVPGFVQESPDASRSVIAPTRINTAGLNASRPRWSPDGHRLAFVGSGGGRPSGVWVVSSFERESQPRLVAVVRDSNFHVPYAGESFAWSPDSRRIAYITATEEADDGERRPTVAGARNDDPRVLTRVRYKSRTSFSDTLRTHVWLAEVDDPAAQPRQLTSGPFHDHAVSFNPRADEIAFLSNREPDPDAVNNSDIYAVSTDGRTRRVTETRGCEYDPQWSPDGRLIAHTATTRDVTTIDSVSEDAHVWVVESGGGGRREISAALDRRARSPRWSADGRSVLFLAGDAGRTLLFRAPISGGPVARIHFDRADDSPLRNLFASPGAPQPQPFQLGNFSVSARRPSLFAFTLSTPLHPSEVWAGESTEGDARRLSAHNDVLLRTLSLSAPEVFSVRSFDGAQVQAWLMRPAAFRPSSGQRHPVVLSVHGGPHGAYGYGFNAEFQTYAARGYAVLYMNPRGSTGYGQKFSDGTFREWGGGDYRDLLAGVDEALSKYSWLDPERMGVVGGSYGGFMVNWIITQTPRFRAAVARASVSNLVSFYGTSLYQDLIQAEFGQMPWDDYDLLWRWSPLRYVRDARTPTLFIHGELDNDVHITQAEEMYTALRRRGVEAALVRYPREGHGFREPRHRRDSIERALDWFDRFLK
ncbi:MAG TPA: S9 family peptidase [Pyrinomonadaceae bacterium]